MFVSGFRQVTRVLQLAYKLLYVELFISFYVVMGYGYSPYTYFFLDIAVFILLLFIFSQKTLFHLEPEEFERFRFKASYEESVLGEAFVLESAIF